jgi:WD40 repeat protein
MTSIFKPFAILGIALLLALAGVTNAQLGNQPRGNEDIVISLDLSPDGTILAIARSAGELMNRYGRVELWDTQTGRLRHVINGFDGQVWSVAFSPDGKTLVTGSVERHDTKIVKKRELSPMRAELKWWNAETAEFKQKVTLPGEGRLQFTAAFSPDGRYLAVAEHYVERQMIIAFEGPGAGTPLGRIESGARFTVDIKLLDAQSGQSYLKMANGFENQSIPFYSRNFRGWPANLRPARPIFSADGRLLAVSTSGHVKIWDAHTGKQLSSMRKSKTRLSGAVFSPDSRFLAVSETYAYFNERDRSAYGEARSEIKFYDVNSWKVSRTLAGNNDMISSLAYGPNGRVMIAGSLEKNVDQVNGTVKLWDLQTNRLLSFKTGGDRPVLWVAVSKTGATVAIQSDLDAVELWDPKTMKVLHTFDENSSGPSDRKRTSRFIVSVKRVLGIGFSPDGKKLCGELEEGEIRCWDPRTGDVKKRLQSDQASESIVAISSDGSALLQLSGIEKIQLWDLVKETEKTLSMPDMKEVSAAAVSSGGRYVAIASTGKINVRDMGTDDTKTLSTEGPVVHLVFSVDGNKLAGVDDEGAISI